MSLQRRASKATVASVAVLLSVVLAIVVENWLVTVVALAAVFALSVWWPSIGVAGVVLSVPVQSAVLLPFVRGEITVTQLMLFGLIGGWGILFWKRRIWVDSVVLGFLLVLAAYAISFVAVDEPSLWLQETYRWLVAGILYLIARSVLTNWNDIRIIIWAMAVGVLDVSIMSATQILEKVGEGGIASGRTVRVDATFGTPNTLAAYLEFTLPLMIAFLPAVWSKRGSLRVRYPEKWLLVGIIAAGIGTLALTQSRGGYLGFAIAGAVLFFRLPGRAKIVTGLATVVLIAGFLTTAPGQSQLKRFTDIQSEATMQNIDGSTSTEQLGAGRGAIWSTAQAMIVDNPLTGVGSGEFDENYREYVTDWASRHPRGQAHNVWLQMGAQAGVWGIIAYAFWFGASIWSIITARRRVTDFQRHWLITGSLAVFAAYSVHSMVDYLNVLSLGLQLSVVTAIALNLAPEPLSRYESVSRASRQPFVTEATSCPQ